MPHSSSYMPEYGLHKIGEAARDMVCFIFTNHLFPILAMDDIATLIKKAIPACSTLQPFLAVLQNLAVETVDDMKFVQKDDLAGVLKPIQARKLLAHVNSK